MADTNNRLSISEAQALIREIARTGSVVPTYHAKYDHPERNYDSQDIEHILRNGVVTREPEYDQKRQDWKYRVEGNTIDGDLAVAITVIVNQYELSVVTVFPI